MVPCESNNCAWHVEIHANDMKNMRAVVHRKSGTAFNLEVHEFLFVYLEFDLHWLAANLAIFNIGLAASG